MVLLDPAAAAAVMEWLGEPKGPGLLDLHHALIYHRRGLWGDAPTAPRSVLLVREGDGQLEAFGAGEPGPAVAWLSRRTGPAVALLAPTEWSREVERVIGAVERAEVLTLAAEPGDLSAVATSVATRRLEEKDREAFLGSTVAPPWALRSWRTFEDLLEHGDGFVVPHGDSAAAIAWTYGRAGPFEAIGVATASRFRRLGLGRAAARALVAEILRRRKVPLWSSTTGNAASLGLARSLGFSVAATETLLRWRPRPRPEHALGSGAKG